MWEVVCQLVKVDIKADMLSDTADEGMNKLRHLL